MSDVKLYVVTRDLAFLIKDDICVPIKNFPVYHASVASNGGEFYVVAYFKDCYDLVAVPKNKKLRFRLKGYKNPLPCITSRFFNSTLLDPEDFNSHTWTILEQRARYLNPKSKPYVFQPSALEILKDCVNEDVVDYDAV